MYSFSNLFQTLAKLKPVASLAGLERRTIAAITLGASTVIVGAGLLISLGSVLADFDDSSATYWIAERARQISHKVFQPSAAERLAEARVAAAKKSRKPNTIAPTSGSQSVCVRLCDGFFFPVGDMHGRVDASSHESVCQSQCPGAPTALYVLPGGSTKIEDAVASRDGRRYMNLPVALRYTQTRDKTCSCKPSGVMSLASAPLAKDFTLRRGDSVVTGAGVKVFRGSRSTQPKPADFMALAQYHDFDSRKRAALTAIERVSMAPGVTTTRQATNVTPRPTPAARTSAVSTPAPASKPERSVRLIEGPQTLIR